MRRETLLLIAVAVAVWWFFFRTPGDAAQPSDSTGVGTSSGGNSGNSVLAWLRELLGDVRSEQRIGRLEGDPNRYSPNAFERDHLDPRTGARSPGGGFLDYTRSQYGNALLPYFTAGSLTFYNPLSAQIQNPSFGFGSWIPGPQRR